MNFTLLSGVRNRKNVNDVNREKAFSFDGTEEIPNLSTMGRMFDIFSGNAFVRNFNLRVHKFIFQWDLVMHLSLFLLSLVSFAFTGEQTYALLPLSVWILYNVLFLIGNRRANRILPGFGRFKHMFTTSIEDFFSPKLLPVISFSYLLVVLSLSLTGRRLGGPPLCYSSCGKCLASWSNSLIIDPMKEYHVEDLSQAGCGYINGKEMLGYYTMAQTSFILFVAVIFAMCGCMAWKVDAIELAELHTAEEWLKREDPMAFKIRDEIMKKFGSPASSIRPEANFVWVIFGIIAALTFTLLGWHNWYVLPPSHTAELLIILNLLTILMTTLILHLGFFGRIISLYQRNYLRVQLLTEHLKDINLLDHQLDAWWNCRNFVLNDDLAIDYDIGGLAVSATFLLNLLIFFVLISQTYREGFEAMLEPPGSYCAYALLYITMCLIKIFALATNTFEEQHCHILGLQKNAGDLGLLPRFNNNFENIDQQSWSSDNLAVSINDNDDISTDEINEGSELLQDNIPKSISSNSLKLGLSVDTNNSLNLGSGYLMGSIPNTPITTPHSPSGVTLRREFSSGIIKSNRLSSSTIPIIRVQSAASNIEARRQTLSEMISQIRKYDPYPCILGIPVMPALFTTCKFYIFICFMLIGTRVMISCLRGLYLASN